MARLIVARRPTVSGALADLSRRVVLTVSDEKGWRLAVMAILAIRTLYPDLTPAEAAEAVMPHSDGR